MVKSVEKANENNRGQAEEWEIGTTDVLYVYIQYSPSVV